MKPARAIALQCQYIQTVQDIYSAAVSYRSTHATILDDMDRRIYKTPQWLKVPQYVRSYVSGYYHAVAHNHYRHLEWRLSFRGELVLSNAIPDGCWQEIEYDKSRHTYIGRTDRSF